MAMVDIDTIAAYRLKPIDLEQGSAAIWRCCVRQMNGVNPGSAMMTAP